MKFIKNISLGIIALLVVFAMAHPAFAKSSYYTNSSHVKVHVPTWEQRVPVGATAQCRDRSYSYSQHRRGTCSGHKGVASWL
ncbi:MAG: hypothetical protein JWM20_871 [Patescibacteria group bacterium]|nr:hypothetical protein [Patescibacteria group bacterium]